MKHMVKEEPHHIDACSQFSIAMATELPLEQIVNGFGGWEGQTMDAIQDYLTRAGFTAKAYAMPYMAKETKGIAIMHSNRGEGHAVAYENGKVYDPNGEVFDNLTRACIYYTNHTDSFWQVVAVIPCEPVATREWPVGEPKKQKEEAL